jgi:hypothetical protein
MWLGEQVYKWMAFLLAFFLLLRTTTEVEYVHIWYVEIYSSI